MATRTYTTKRTYTVYTRPRGVWLLQLEEKGDTWHGLYYDLSRLAAISVIQSCLQIQQIPVDPARNPRLYNMCAEVLRSPKDAIRVYRLRSDG